MRIGLNFPLADGIACQRVKAVKHALYPSVYNGRPLPLAGLVYR